LVPCSHNILCSFFFSTVFAHTRRRKRWKTDLALGRWGEDLAHRYLRKRGYTVVARNYRAASGEAEADIIAWHGESLVFVEVKTRMSDEYGSPERAVGSDKTAHLRSIARDYARKADVPLERVRFDLVTIVFGKPPKVQLLPDAFRI
jgi:putative endonuclease